MLTIILNGEKHEIDDVVTLDRLLDLFSLPKQRVAVELNKQVVGRRNWENTPINDGDRVEVVHFVGGG